MEETPMFIDEFCEFVRERERIRINKESGRPFPWTADPILQKYKFTNVWRQDDAVTKAIMKEISVFNTPENKIFNAIWLRTLNKKESIEIAPLFTIQYGMKLLPFQKNELKFGDAFVTVISWKLEKGQTRFDVIEKFMNEIAEERKDFFLLNGRTPSTVRDFLPILRPRDWFVGLPRYEVMLDVWQILGIPEQYVNIGPGAVPVVKRIMEDIGLVYHEKTKQQDFQTVYTTIAEMLGGMSHPKWGALTRRCVEGMCCEYRKYLNLKSPFKNGRKRLYRRDLSSL